MRERELIEKGVLVKYPGCYLLRQPMPYPLANSNSYLIEVDNGWAVIDVGVDLPSTRQLWAAVVAALGISWRHIKAIYVTHCHPDHLGASAWLQQMCQAPVYMYQPEIDRARCFVFLRGDYADAYLKATGEEMRRHGFTDSKRHRLALDWEREVRPLYPEPEWLLPLQLEEVVRFYGLAYQVMELPGHTDGQIGFYSPDKRCLISADLVAPAGGYLHFTDWPHTRSDNPLGDLMAAVKRVQTQGIEELYPGHGLRIDNADHLLGQLLQRHQTQLMRIGEKLTQPYSASEMYQELLPISDEDYIHYHRVSLGEALGYLRYLEAAGQVRSFYENGVLKFVRV